jgi:hypothetical protein
MNNGGYGMIGKFCGPIMSEMDVCLAYPIQFVFVYYQPVEQKRLQR